MFSKILAVLAIMVGGLLCTYAFAKRRSFLKRMILAEILLIISLVVVSCSSATTPSPTPIQWEYKLEVISFDAKCAKNAFSPYQERHAVRQVVEFFGYSHYAVGNLVQSENCLASELPPGALGSIIESYVSCGQTEFNRNASQMGAESWEIVSYSRMQYTTSGEYCAAVITDYGYEILWKRPMVAN